MPLDLRSAGPIQDFEPQRTRKPQRSSRTRSR